MLAYMLRVRLRPAAHLYGGGMRRELHWNAAAVEQIDAFVRLLPVRCDAVECTVHLRGDLTIGVHRR